MCALRSSWTVVSSCSTWGRCTDTLRSSRTPYEHGCGLECERPTAWRAGEERTLSGSEGTPWIHESPISLSNTGRWMEAAVSGSSKALRRGLKKSSKVEAWMVAATQSRGRGNHTGEPWMSVAEDAVQIVAGEGTLVIVVEADHESLGVSGNEDDVLGTGREERSRTFSCWPP